MNKNDKKNKEIGEDTTKYGEFVSTFFAWETPKQQREVVEKLENITKEPKDKNKKEEK
ncbi:MAG: hypothetical protein IKF38_01320 [Clostridia bacterium]|nr:hypothetical protein [Clostridia bacterium]